MKSELTYNWLAQLHINDNIEALNDSMVNAIQSDSARRNSYPNEEDRTTTFSSLNQIDMLITASLVNIDKPYFSINQPLIKPLIDSNNRSLKTQKWLGHIIEIHKDSFIAKLEDITQGGTDEIGEFSMDEVAPDDLELLKIGAAFYWSISKDVTRGQVEKKSVVRFQRLPSWTVSEADAAFDRADELMRFLILE